jgi:hypothetical protein
MKTSEPTIQWVKSKGKIKGPVYPTTATNAQRESRFLALFFL